MSIAEIAAAVEDRGLDGLWLADHTHIRSLPTAAVFVAHERHLRMTECVTGLAFAAAATTRIRIGTGVLLAAQRDPIVTANALATIDQQSGGRLVVGVGFGWNEAEMRAHGVEPSSRHERTREQVLAIRRLWECDEASFDGTYFRRDLAGFRLDPCWSWPKPMQRPLPVLVGAAAGPRTFRHVAQYGQGWIPTRRERAARSHRNASSPMGANGSR